jgi:hypothetical protein
MALGAIQPVSISHRELMLATSANKPFSKLAGYSSSSTVPFEFP